MTVVVPTLMMFAGPNGSGKSSLAAKLAERDAPPINFINADEIEQTLGGPSTNRSERAMAEAERRRRAFMDQRDSFSFETVMSHPGKAEILRTAAAMGYETTLAFVSTSSVTINVARVALRVRKGGHPVAEGKIVKRYERSLHLLYSAVRAAHRSIIFDNSGSEDAAAPGRPMRLVAEYSSDGIIARPARIGDDPPAWLIRHLIEPALVDAQQLDRFSVRS